MNLQFEKILVFGVGGGVFLVLFLGIAARIRKLKGSEKTIDQVYLESKPKNVKLIFWVFFLLCLAAAAIAFVIAKPTIR